jgi:hypothetical protein
MVVRMSLVSVVGRRSVISSRSSVIVVEGGTGTTRVEGSPRPPKVVMRTLRFSKGIFDLMRLLASGN